MSLLQMSFSGAVMILAIIVIRSVSLHKLPKRTFIVLWAVALLRLLLPYSLPSALSVYSLASRLVPESETAVDVGAMLPSSAGTGASGGSVGTYGTAASNGSVGTYKAPSSGGSAAPAAPVVNSGSTAPVVSAPSAPETAPAAPATSPLDIDPWTAVWLIGATGCALFFAVVYIKCRREFNMSLPAEHEYASRWLESHKLRRRLSIRQSDRISAPLSYGILRPVILLPKTVGWSDENAMNYVLEHEYVHIRRFDSLMKFLIVAAACIHWFNPMVWLMYVLANRDIELSCDEAVIRQFGNKTKSDYAMTLIRMGEQQSGFAPFCNGFSKNAIEERIVAIMKIKKKSVLALIVAFCLVVGITAACATSAKEPDAASGSDLTPLNAPADDSFDKFGGVDYTDTNAGTCYMYGFSGPGTMFPMQFWSAEEYAELLETAKQQLPELVGMRIYHSDNTVTVVTQEQIDERLAWAEDMLTEIENGSRLNKMFSGLEEFTGGYEPEYWTAEEYSEWLNNERNYLLTLPGTTGIKEYTAENGEYIKEEFTWSYDIVFDIIDRYESEFQSIENGLQVRKYYPDRKITFGNGTIFWDGEPLPDISEYEPFGVSFGEMDTALFYNGEKIRYFEDSVVTENGVEIKYNYYRPGGDISIRTVRNPGLSDADPFGEIVAIEELSNDEATRLIRANFLKLDSEAAEVNWITAEECSRAIAEERARLEALLGTKDTTIVNGRETEFTWTEKRIDDQLAPLETTLAQIESGFKFPKASIRANFDDITADEIIDQLVNSSGIYYADEMPSTEEYRPFGIKVDENDGTLLYNGEKVRCLSDTVDVGGYVMSHNCVYFCKDGSVNLRAIRCSATTPNGGTTPYGPIIEIEAINQETSDTRLRDNTATLMALGLFGGSEVLTETELLEQYASFGLHCESDSSDLSMSWNDTPVHCVYDTHHGIWIANNLHGSDLPDNAISLETVYENGKLTGLRECECAHALPEVAAPTYSASTLKELPSYDLQTLFKYYQGADGAYSEGAAAEMMERFCQNPDSFLSGLAETEQELQTLIADDLGTSIFNLGTSEHHDALLDAQNHHLDEHQSSLLEHIISCYNAAASSQGYGTHHDDHYTTEHSATGTEHHSESHH